MRAILLAAGSGRRFGVDMPKCLVQVAGRSLLERHLAAMAGAGITHVTVVTGFASEKIELALKVLRAAERVPVELETHHNELFKHGSIVSLQCTIERLADGGIWMDADVLYPSSLLRRLVESTHANCVLLDGRSSEQGEEMMLAVKDARVCRIARSVGSDWDLVGESVGFFKVDSEGATAMKQILNTEIAEGRLDQEHEDALNTALNTTPFGHERVDDLPWTEIDFQQDLTKAESLAREVDRPAPEVTP
jgi:choline kinase